jgi:hypothetical protein
MSVCGIFVTPLPVFRHKFCIYRRGVLNRKILYMYKIMLMNMYQYECFVSSVETERNFLSLNIRCIDYIERHTIELNVVFLVIYRQCHCVGGSSVILLVLFFIVLLV